MEFLEKELEKTLKLLGCREITSKTQRKNGTTCWELPVYIRWAPHARVKIAEYSSGYVRNTNEGFSCYQLNYRNYRKQFYGKNGEYEGYQTTQILLMSRAERLAKLVSYVAHRLNKINKTVC